MKEEDGKMCSETQMYELILGIAKQDERIPAVPEAQNLMQHDVLHRSGKEHMLVGCYAACDMT